VSGVNYVLPNNVQNLTLTGTAALTGTGNNLDNVITANAGNATLDGGGGNDTLIGGTGLDTFCMDSTMGQDTVIDASSQGAIIKLKPNIALGDLMATRQGDDLLLQLDASDSMLIQGYYANPQTTWSIQDANGNVTTPQAVLQTMAQLREVDKAEKLFINQCDASIKRSYLSNGGFTLQADGSLISRNAIAYSAYAYDSVKTTSETTTRYFLNANGAIASTVALPAVIHAPTDTWSLVRSIYSGVVGAAVAGESVSVKRVNMTSDAAVIYADTPYSSNLQSMGYQWFNMSWTSTYEGQTGPSDDGMFRQYIFQNGYSSDQYATGLGALLGYQDTVYTSATRLFSANGTPLGDPLASPGNLITTGSYPQALLSAYSLYHYNYEIQKIDLSGTSGQTVYANAQTVVNSDSGNDIIYDAGFAYSGTGNDTMIGGGTLMAGTGNNLLEYGNKMIAGVGDDTLIGGNTMIAGNGNDQIFAGSGAASIQINPNIASNDLIGGTGDTTHFLDAVYQSMGITDIQRHRDYGGMYAVDVDGDINYYNDGQLAAIAAGGIWPVTFIQPLPEIVPPAANDFQALATYYAQGFLPQHTVAFGPGVTASDLHLTWGETIRSISGLPTDPQMHYTTLNISWGTNNQSIQVMIPHTDDPLGSGTSQFTFANGTTLSMADMIALAPAAPTFDPQIIHLNLGGGQQTIIENPGVSGDIIQFGAGITVGNAQFVLNGSDLLITYGTQGDSALVQGFAPNGSTGNYSIGQFMFADGSAGAYTNDGQGNAFLEACDANGNLIGIFWQSADGSYGNETSNADGSTTGIAHNPDGSYYTYADDGQGNSNELDYNASGVKVGANWGKPGGTYGSDVFNADGSSSGTVFNADNSYNNYVNDGHGNITTIYFDHNSIETGYSTATNDGLGNTTTTNYSAAGIKLSDSWVNADGSSGSDTFNANGTSSGTVINPAKGYSDTFTKTPLGSGRVETVINYTYSDGSTYTTDTVKATNGDYTQTWSRSDGSSGVTNHNAATGENTGTVNNPAKGFTEVFDNTILAGGSTESKITYTYTDGSTYTTDTVKASDGSYAQTWSRSDGSSGVTNHNAATGENTGTVNNPAKGFTEVFDNTILADGSTESKITYTYTDGSTYTTDTVKASDGSYAQTWGRSDGSSGVTNHNAATGENTGTVNNPAKGFTEVFDNTVLSGGTTESKITYTYTDSSTYTTDTVKAADGSYAQTWSRSDGSSGVTNHNAATGENTGTASYPAKGYTQIFDNTILADGSTESKITYTYTDGSTYTTDTVKAANGDYAQTWSRSDGSSGVTNHNALTGENTGTASYPAKGYTQVFDNTVLAGGSTESKITYTYTDSSTYTTDTVKATNGDYAQTWSRSDGSSGVTNHNALTGENTGTVINPAKGFTEVFDNTILAGGSTESKITYTYTYTDSSTYTTDTVKASDGSYAQTWNRSDGSSGVTNHNGLTGENTGTASYPAKGYTQVFDNTVLADGTTESKITYTYTNGSTYTTDTVKAADTSYTQVWSKSDGTSGTKAVDSTGVVVADSWVHADGSQGVDASGNHLVLGTAAVNSIKAVTGNEIMIGGLSNDTFTTGAGNNLIAFNKGDGKDTVIDIAGTNNSISLGGNFAFADLALQKNGNNLILDIGATDSITLKNWYTGTKNIVDLQVIETAMSDFNHGSADVLRNSNVETFDFQQMVTAFDQARAANPGITMWGLTNALLTAHLSSSDTAALGGDLAYVYGSQGSLSGMNVSAAESTLSNSQFAAAAQTLNPWPTLNTGTVQIR
jgi:hypothetical protein